MNTRRQKYKYKLPHEVLENTADIISNQTKKINNDVVSTSNKDKNYTVTFKTKSRKYRNVILHKSPRITEVIIANRNKNDSGSTAKKDSKHEKDKSKNEVRKYAKLVLPKLEVNVDSKSFANEDSKHKTDKSKNEVRKYAKIVLQKLAMKIDSKSSSNEGSQIITDKSQNNFRTYAKLGFPKSVKKIECITFNKNKKNDTNYKSSTSEDSENETEKSKNNAPKYLKLRSPKLVENSKILFCSNSEKDDIKIDIDFEAFKGLSYEDSQKEDGNNNYILDEFWDFQKCSFQNVECSTPIQNASDVFSSPAPSGYSDILKSLGPNWPDSSSEQNVSLHKSVDNSGNPEQNQTYVISKETDHEQSSNITNTTNNQSYNMTHDLDNDESTENPMGLISFNYDVANVDDLTHLKNSEPILTNHDVSDTGDLANQENTKQLEELVSSSYHQEDSTYQPDSTSQPNSSCQPDSSTINRKSLSRIESPKFLPIDIRNITVPMSSTGKGNSKKHFCIFCKKLQSKLVRHFLVKHKNETEVKNFKFLPSNHSDRKAAIDKLRKAGDFLHNTNRKYNTGILITTRQRSKKSNKVGDDYIACTSCNGHFAKSTIRFHNRRCNKSYKKGSKTVLQEGRKIYKYIHDVACEKLIDEVFSVLRDDDVVKCIRYDELIIHMGNRLCNKYTLTHQHEHIRAQLRILGRLKLELLKVGDEFEEFKNVFKPENFDKLVAAVRKVAKWNTNTMTFETPGNAKVLTTLLKKCAAKLSVEYIKQKKFKKKKEVEYFLTLWDDEILTLINKKANDDQIDRKLHKKQVLPTQSDIKILYDFLRKECGICLDILNNEFDLSAWKHLNKCTLISVQIFNRRRAGELERLKITSYTNKQTIEDLIDKNQFKTLSKSSIQFTKQFQRLVLRGKLGREVSILMSPFDIACFDVLMKFREEAGVNTDNEYLFAQPSGSARKYIRACPLMRQFAADCNATVPSSLRGTQIRKHIATLTAVLNVKESDVDRLAHFMGHSKEIHKSIYRIPVPLAEITSVSKMLTTAIGMDTDDSENEYHSEDDSHSDKDNSGSSDDENRCVRDSSQLSSSGDGHTNSSNNNVMSETNPTIFTKKSEKCSSLPTVKSQRLKWSNDEKRAIFEWFGDLLALPKLPSLQECKNAQSAYECLKRRTPMQIKSWIDNQRRAKNRKRANQSTRNRSFDYSY